MSAREGSGRAGADQRRHRRAGARPPADAPRAQRPVRARARVARRATPRRRSPSAGRALGDAFAPPLRARGAARARLGVHAGRRGARAGCARGLRAAAHRHQRRPLRGQRAAGSGATSRRVSRGFADAAGLTLHVRLIDGEDSHHVLEAIFKALGARARAQALRGRIARSQRRRPMAEKEIVRTERAPGAVPGRAVQPGGEGRRARLRRRSARRCARARRRWSAPGSRSRPSR